LAQSLSPTEAVEALDDAPADDVDFSRQTPETSRATLGIPSEIRTDTSRIGEVRPGECLTHKRVGEEVSIAATVGSKQADSAVQEPVSRSEDEVVDAKTPSDKSSEEAGDDEVEAPPNSDLPGSDVEWSRRVLVLTTVAQVRAALQHAREVGHEDVVILGRCEKCGRVGRVVHFDGELRSRARDP
jgi:hypothetical protein